MTDINVNHLPDSIEDIMGEYMESPAYNTRMKEVNKLYFDFRKMLLPAKQPLFDQLFMKMQAFDDDFAMEAFKKGVAYGKSEFYGK